MGWLETIRGILADCKMEIRYEEPQQKVVQEKVVNAKFIEHKK